MTTLCNRRTLAIVLFALIAAWPAAGQPYPITIGTSLLMQAQQQTTLAARSYEIINLGALPDWKSSRGRALNDAGQVVGDFRRPGETFTGTFVWDPGTGALTELAPLPGYEGCDPVGINLSGDVAGTSYANGEPPQWFHFTALLWSGGPAINLDLPGFGFAFDINDAGEIVGYWEYNQEGEPYNLYAFLWRDGVLTDLGAGIALANNNAGQVVGSIHSSNGPRAALWEKVGDEWAVTELGGLAPGRDSYAQAINDLGQVVGEAENLDDDLQPVRFIGGVAISLVDTEYGWATAINNAGQIVGRYEVDPNDHVEHAFLWEGGVFTDLNELLSAEDAADWDLRLAADINNYGEITGDGTYLGEKRAFLMRPSPSASLWGESVLTQKQVIP